ncbi:MAG: transglutaminase-like domain-containing protein [Promethearchaeota archaeon]
MSTETLEKDPAPSAIRYLVLASAFTCLITAISFVQAQIGTSTQEEQFYQGAFLGFTLVSGVTLIEWFLLRRSRKMIGPYGITIMLEVIKTVLFSIATTEYIQTVSGSSSDPFFLHRLLSLGTLFLLALTKVARTRIDQLAQREISRNILNLLPTILIAALFLGTYVTEIAGLGTPRQRSSFEDYTDKYYDWELYNTPTWDATYLLENLLDQFTAGIQNPYDVLFTVRSDNSDPTSPPAYWRLGSLGTYEFFNKGDDPTTRWTSTDPGYRELTPSPSVNSYSQRIDASERAARFTVRVPLDHSDSIADVSVNPSFVNHLPTTWNGEDGSFVDAVSFKLYDALENELTPTTTKTQEIYPVNYAAFRDLRGIYADIRGVETSSEEGILEYTMDYKDISNTLYDAAIFSRTKSEYLSCLNNDLIAWNDIKDLYLHLPNTSSELPSTAYVSGIGTISNPQVYSDWAPEVVAAADTCTIEGQTVFSQAYAEMLRLAPNSYLNTQLTQIPGLGVSPDPQEDPDSTGEYDLIFDFDMWLGNQNPLQPMAHPRAYEDYNEWFMVNKNGVSLHFASLFVTLMRLRGIPSRVVIGYLGGQNSEDNTRREITNMMLHAWAEVLIPIREILPVEPFIDKRVEWVSFDPLLKFLSDRLQIGTPLDMPILSQVANTVFIGSDVDYQTIGPEALPAPSYVTTNVSGVPGVPKIISFQETINLSVRIMMITSPTTWMPWQPGCEYLMTNVTFYWGNSRDINSATPIQDSSIDGSGYASCIFPYSIFDHGDTVWFFAEVIFDEGEPQEVVKTTRSVKHSIS